MSPEKLNINFGECIHLTGAVKGTTNYANNYQMLLLCGEIGLSGAGNTQVQHF